MAATAILAISVSSRTSCGIDGAVWGIGSSLLEGRTFRSARCGDAR
jgi:hypothetical protein